MKSALGYSNLENVLDFASRLNLVIYYLRQDDVNEAYTLIKDLVFNIKSQLSRSFTARGSSV